MAWLTMGLQIAVSAAFFGFALCALGVFRRTEGGVPAHRAAWGLMAGAFLVHASDKLAMESFGTLAMARGNDSAVMEAYVLWYPLFNHSRTFMLLAVWGLLLFIALRPGTRFDAAFYRRAGVLLGAGLLVGVLAGLGENGAIAREHFSKVAQWDVVELLLLLSALFAALLTSAVDRMLWFCLAVYAFSLSLNTLWFAAFAALRDLPDTWSPKPWVVQGYRLALTVVMAWFAWQRLRQARRGARVPALLEGPQPRPSMVG
ncbi:MAG TPA: hypothetical protein VFQ45_22400 [Longimicrobium sp.]|nr:hypothetical protein [Longimicrobium sp.]